MNWLSRNIQLPCTTYKCPNLAMNHHPSGICNPCYQKLKQQLRDQDDNDRIKKRMDIVRNIISEMHINLIEINSNGSTPLARIFHLIQYGDFVSYYLAVLNKVDPSPVKVIQKLKKQLEDSN